MTEKKIMRRVWWFDYWQIGKIESWLSDMAARGWHLFKSGLVFAVFSKGEPEQMRYRCDIFKRRSPDFQERINVYEAVGWEYVLSMYVVNVFRAPAAAKIPEIHTDPQEQASSMTLLLRPYIWISVGILLFFLVSTAVPALFLDNFLLLHVGIPSVFMLLATAYVLFTLASGIVGISRIISRLSQGIPLDHALPYRGDMLAKPGMLLIGGIIIIFAAVNLSNFTSMPFGGFQSIPLGELPVIRISQVLPHEQTAPIEDPDIPGLNHYTTNSSLLVPGQWHLMENVAVRGRQWPNGSQYSPMLRASAYQARTEGLAQSLAEGLAASSLLPDKGSLAKVGSHPFAAMWELQDGNWYEFVAVQDEYVFHIAYNGMEAKEDLIILAKAKLDSLTKAEGDVHLAGSVVGGYGQ